MKMTDESMAKALGYFMDKNIITGNPMVRKPHKKYPDLPSTARAEKLPKFTTSLDAIVAEIEARGLKWTHEGPYRNVCGEKVIHCVTVYDYMGDDGNVPTYRGSSAPIALCAALLAHLKRKP